MAVPAGPTEKRYTGNGVTTIFTIPFLLLAASDLDVFINGVEVVSGFTITGVGNPTSIITFTTAPANLSSILLNLNVPFERLNDYQENGDFLSSTVNRDFDRIWQALKQLLRFSTRSLTLGFFDVDGAGWYRAKANGIRDLADPVEPQDAATKSSVETYVNELLATGTGPANNAANVLYATPGGITRTVQSRLREVVAITDFTGAVEGAANSSAVAFAAAEASAHQSIYLPYGIWNAGATALTKRYYGLGKLITGGSYRGQAYTSITSNPQKATSEDFEFAATADISHVNVSRANLGRIRVGLSEYYFNSATTPYWADMVSQAGHSGTSGKFQNTVAVGGQTLNLSAACPELIVGAPVSISNGTQAFNATITGNSGSTITFSPPSPYAFNSVYTSGPVPTYGFVTIAKRTMNTLHMSNVEHQGGGDSYVWTGRIINSNKFTQPSQDNYHETSTIGLIGGDLLTVVNGGFATGSEINMLDSNYQGSFQTAAMGHLVNLQRTADNGLYGCTWMGFFTKSEGTQYADVAYRATGRFKRGLDFGGMQFDSARAAIAIPRTSRIYLDASGANKDTRGTNWWSDTPGGSYIGTGSGGDVIIAQGNQGRIIIEDNSTRIRAKTAGDHVILDQGYLDIYTDVAASAGASQGYAVIFINGVARKIQYFAA